MKKLVKLVMVGLVLLGLVGTSLFAGDYDINTNNIQSFYNFKDKKCDTLTFKDKANTIRDIRNGYIIVNEKYTNDAGVTYILVGSDTNGKEFEMVFTSNYNQCRLYEDLILKKLDVKVENYINYPVKNK